jgi:hypothetical protein
MASAITGEGLSAVTSKDLEAAGAKETIPGQIPFYQFDESELTSFDPNSSQPESAEDYLKSVILEARKQPEIVRANIPTSKFKTAKNSPELTFKQLSASSFISKSNFEERYEIDPQYLPAV